MTTHRDVQQIARITMDVARREVRSGQTLTSLRHRCEQSLLSLGADSFWYYGIGAFIFSGDSTIVSISGRDYETPDRVIASDDILTIDLSPQQGGVWGDFARTLVLEDGFALEDPLMTSNLRWREGLQAEKALHRHLLTVARPSMQFDDLHMEMTTAITELGFENLDFKGNLGHSIERNLADRVYFEPGNTLPIGEVPLFTFEPHISRQDSDIGFKHENIYYFEDGRLAEL